MHKQNDTELIAQAIDGNQAAYAELVDRYKNALYRHCFVIVRDEDVAEDIAQETFVAAYYKLSSYTPAFKSPLLPVNQTYSISTLTKTLFV